MDRIRFAKMDDGPALAAIYAPHVTETATSFEVVAPSADEMARRVNTVLAHAPWLVLERAGQVVGYAYASQHRERAAYQWSVDVCIYVARAEHRTGVGRALYARLFEMLSAQGFYVAHAGITLPNVASVALHESLGFQPVGVYEAVGFKCGAWHNVGWWRLPLRARDSSPGPPRLLGATG